MATEHNRAVPFARIVFERLSEALGEGEVDLLDEEDGDATVTTDDWSIQFSDRPRPQAWLAIDSEPDDSAQFDAARRNVMSRETEELFAGIDADHDRELSRLLRASSDAFSAAFAAALCSSESMETFDT